ncbi:MAG: metallophosphoesterase [Saprospiraceae bacterium]|nr:metallophosphoesterase [Saprospiraceae bacterium]
MIFILSISNFSFCKERSTWSYVHGANDETLFSFTIPNFFDAEKVNLPHRLTLPNSVFWYYKKLKTKSNATIKLNADDGAQVWVNHQRIKPDRDGNFPFQTASDSAEIIIRVLNNAVAGGLLSVEILDGKDVNIQENSSQTKIQSNITPLMSKKKNIQPDKKEISFSFWGDSQGGWNTFNRFAQKMAGFDDDFSLGLGDLVADGSRDSEWTSFRKAIEPLQKKMPLFFIPGNHDYDGYYDDLIPQNYLQHITAEKSGKTYYDFYVGKAAFIALDPNRNFPLSIDAEQQKWMLQTIQSRKWKEADWRFVVIHQVPYGQGWEGYEGDHFIRTLIDTLAGPQKIDFVLSGHIHDYERLTKKYGDHYTTFVISGGAGGGIEPKESNPTPVMDRLIKQHHFGRMTLRKNKAIMYIYDINGDIIDQLTILTSNK